MRWLSVLIVLLTTTAYADINTIGPNGIDSAGLLDASGTPLDGRGIDIGDIEGGRPGDPQFDIFPQRINTFVDPAAVFYQNITPANTFNPFAGSAVQINDHDEGVAGIMISRDVTDPDGPGPLVTPTGVATQANLYAAGFNPTIPTAQFNIQAAVTASHIATLPNVKLRAVNMSFGLPLSPGVTVPDGNSVLTQFVDWSATKHDILDIVAGNEGAGGKPVPTDNFNGMTVAYSEPVNGVYLKVGSGNNFNFADDAFGDRTSVSILAPGVASFSATGNMTQSGTGTSIAAPHVAGTVALLEQYANERLAKVAPGWDIDARRHEVVKAVIMNSADKLIDNGTVVVSGNIVPQGSLLGMTRTVLKQDGVSTWLNSPAYDDDAQTGSGLIALDEQMGSGQLNANRAVEQFKHGEFNPSRAVPMIG